MTYRHCECKCGDLFRGAAKYIQSLSVTTLPHHVSPQNSHQHVHQALG